jgi:perosamine synthetase
MYIPSWPCPTASQFSNGNENLPYPLAAGDRKFFYVARNGIYHLFRTLSLASNENVLVPNYHSGNETSAMRAAGVDMRFYPIRRDWRPDLEALERLCNSQTRALYVIHFAGWPQPIKWMAQFCRERGLLLIEDCALSCLSEFEGRPLGSFGDYAIHCLYKTLPLPNGAVLTQNRGNLDLSRIPAAAPANLSVMGRSVELILESLRAAFPLPGAALAGLKAGFGRLLTALSVERDRVGNIGFDPNKVDQEMSGVCHWLLAHFDYERIRARRRANFTMLEERLRDKASTLPISLSAGVCPLFFPILVEDKGNVAAHLRRRGIGVVEFWNEGDPAACGPGSEDATFLRRHLLELPIHQNVTEAQLDYISKEVARSQRAEDLCFASS